MGSGTQGGGSSSPWEDPTRVAILGVVIGALLAPPCTSVAGAVLGGVAAPAALSAIVGVGLALAVGQLSARDLGGESVLCGLVAAAAGALILGLFGIELTGAYAGSTRGATDLLQMILALPAWTVALATAYLGSILGLAAGMAFAARFDPGLVRRIARDAGLVCSALVGWTFALVSRGAIEAIVLGVAATVAGVLLSTWIEVRRGLT